VTHFYSRQKNTDEMIKMSDLLRRQYRGCRGIHLSWDAASWHISKKLIAHSKMLNEEAVGGAYPIVETAPLPPELNSSMSSSRYSAECPGRSSTTTHPLMLQKMLSTDTFKSGTLTSL
jgi:hypothetical protein